MKNAYTHMSPNRQHIARTRDSSIDDGYNTTKYYKNKLFYGAVSHRDILHFPVPSREFKSLGHSRFTGSV